MDGLDDIVEEFLVESHENLDQLDADLVALEQEPELPRAAVQHLPHDPHDQGHQRLPGLQPARGGHPRRGEHALPAAGRRAGADPARAPACCCRWSTPSARCWPRSRPAAARGRSTSPPSSPPSPRPWRTRPPRRAGRRPAAEIPAAAGRPPRPRRPPREGAPPKAAAAKPAAAQKPAAPQGRARAGRRRRAGRSPRPRRPPSRSSPVPTPRPAAVPSAVAAAEAAEHETGGAAPRGGQGRRAVADSTIRVDVDLLDELMLLVGELVLTRNQIVQNVARQTDTDLIRASQRLNLIASELQEGVMKTRMQPIDHIWSKLPRVVRDLGLQLQKSIRLEMEGRETELDKTLLEAVKDPLTHLVRNSVDHGIEAADARKAAGKPAEGVLTLRARHESGQVVVEVADDGAGIDPAKLGAKAVERGLVTADAARPDEPGRHPAADLPARLLHRRRGHQRLRPRRRHGRRQDQHRVHRRHHRGRVGARPGHRLPAAHPADPGDRPGADRRVRRRPLRHPADQPAGAGQPGRREGRQRGRGGRRRAGLPAARRAAPARPAHRRPRPAPPSGTTATSSSRCCGRRAAASAWSSTGSSTPRRSWSRPSAAS